MDLAQLDLLACPRTGQALRVDAAIDGDGATLHYGVLRAESFRYPVVHGIALLTTTCEPILRLIQQDRLREATATAAMAGVERTRALPFLDAGSGLRAIGRAASRLSDRVRERIVERDVERLFGPGDTTTVNGDPLELLFLGSRRPNPEGYRYFRYRFGTPRYLTALALWDALPAATGAVLDVGCGAGNLTWAMTQRPGHGPVIGIDPSFAQLLAARSLAPEATFVCGDGLELPVRDGSVERVLSSDVLPYVPHKVGAARELARVLRRDGTAILTALRNAGHDHVHGGEPLSVEGWLALLGSLRHRLLLSDDAILDRYLAGEGPGGLGAEGSDLSQTVSIVAGHEPPELQRGSWAVWPHARGPLAPHPLLEPVGLEPGGMRHERRFPSDVYHVDNRRIVDYLPETCVIPQGAPTDGGTEGPWAGLIARVALLALPHAPRSAERASEPGDGRRTG